MTCKKCGAPLAANENFCHNCGEKQELQPAPSYPAPPQYPYPYYPPYPRVSPYDAPNIGYAILCFFFPIIGLILYLVWKDEFPQRAKSAGKGALIGVITSVGLMVIFFAIWFGLLFWVISESMYYW